MNIDPIHLYKCQRKNASSRVDVAGNPILFLLTFEEWLKIWVDSGHWEERGSSKGKYCMSRKNDLGNYEVGNVFIQPFGDNVREAQVKPKSESHRAKIGASQVGMKHASSRIEKRQQTLKDSAPLTCPHCGKVGHIMGMTRWHFDNCKRAQV